VTAVPPDPATSTSPGRSPTADRIVQQIAAAVSPCVPPGPFPLLVRFAAAGPVSEVTLDELRPSPPAAGTTAPVTATALDASLLPPQVLDLGVALRDATARTDHGAWFTAWVVIAHGTAVSVEFDHATPPPIDPPPPPGCYAEDLARYPRSPDHVPPWLQEHLRLAAADPEVAARLDGERRPEPLRPAPPRAPRAACARPGPGRRSSARCRRRSPRCRR